MEVEIEIAAWRGECLNFFARTEAAVSKSLDDAFSAGKVTKIRHLAGQRLADLAELSEQISGTNKQLAAFSNALRTWQSVESKRQFLAHGTLMIAQGQQGWVAIFDLTTYRGSERSAERWTVTQAEASEFLESLKDAFKRLSGQLGHFRKRIEGN